ncbi:MAG: DUF975 family protein [Prevotella sp.]|nr:DUF975 family protein [Prevotella sp.]
MLQNSQIRKRALEALDGNWGSAAVFMLVYIVITFIVSNGGQICLSPLGSAWQALGSLASVLLIPMGYALTVGFLGFLRGRKLEVAGLFRYYPVGRVWILGVLTAIYTILWSLLLIIPGVIKAYSYMMAPYILKDNPEMGGEEAIVESMKMMKGYKMKLFLLDLSFIGWAILALLTLGLGFILLYPYVLTARAKFYEELKAERGECVKETV